MTSSPPHRVSVVGSAGSGKTRLAARLAAILRVPHIELDALMHQAGWRPRPEAEFLAEVEQLTDRPGWVIDGNYHTVVTEGQVWRRADTVVWLDLSRRLVMRQLLGRTLRRVLLREQLWNGNRERLSNLLSLDPDRSIIVWSWTRHDLYRRRYAAAMADPRWSQLRFVRLRSRAQAEVWLASLEAGGV